MIDCGILYPTLKAEGSSFGFSVRPSVTFCAGRICKTMVDINMTLRWWYGLRSRSTPHKNRYPPLAYV